jgi:hypothetical protein
MVTNLGVSDLRIQCCPLSRNLLRELLNCQAQLLHLALVLAPAIHE